MLRHAASSAPAPPPPPRASRTVELLQREHDRGAELFFHVGDISYANGREEVRPAAPRLLCLLPHAAPSASTQAPRLPPPLLRLLLNRPLAPPTRATPSHTLCPLHLFPQIWDTFMESIEPFARHTPYMVGVGNHGAP